MSHGHRFGNPGATVDTLQSYRDTSTVQGLRLKLRLSEMARERAEAQLSAERNIPAAGRRWDVLMGAALGALLTLLTVGLIGWLGR